MIVKAVERNTDLEQSRTSVGATRNLEVQHTKINPTREFMLRHIGFDKKIVRAKGAQLKDEDGNHYLDFISQYGALPFGHGDQLIQSRVTDFFDNDEGSLLQPLKAPEAEKLATRLLALSPLEDGYCSFCNSGAESVEIAIKMARVKTGRKLIVSCTNGFHGKTMGAGAATGNKNYSKPFLSNTQNFKQVELNDLKALKRVLATKKAAAVIVELVQGEGGMRTLSEEVLLSISELCQKYGALLVVDEVQTGLGRLGYIFGLEQFPNVKADIICLAKAIGGGYVPLGAVLCDQRVWTEEFGLYHSSTFANNNFTCAIGNAVIDRLLSDDQAQLKQVREQSVYLRESVQALVQKYPQAYSSLRGDGLMLGLELTNWPQAHSYFLAHASFHGLAAPLVCGYLLNRHQIITAPVFNHNSVIRLEPNLDVTKEQIDRLIFALNDIGHLISERKFSSLFAYVIGLNAEEVNYTEASLSDDPVMHTASPTGKCLGSFAFLIHPTMKGDLMRIMPESINSLQPEHRTMWHEWMDSWFKERYEPAPVLHAPAVVNSDGDYVEGWLISCPLTPERMMRLKKGKREKLMAQYFQIAEALNVDRVGLGAFTSIITRGGSELPERNVPVTSGNSFTGIMSAHGLIEAVNSHIGPSHNVTLAVIGAAGAVGRIAALEASRSFANIVLFGNPKNTQAIQGLKEVRAEIVWRAVNDYLEGEVNVIADKLIAAIGDKIDYSHPKVMLLLLTASQKNYDGIVELIEQEVGDIISTCINVSVSLEQELPNCGAVISATSNGKGFVSETLLAKDCIVCDAARPPDFSQSLAQKRPDIFAFEGGVVRLPEPIKFGQSNILGFPADVNLACLSETIILAMAQLDGDYSIGKELDIVQAREIYRYSQKFGFKLPEEVIGEDKQTAFWAVREAV